MNARFVFSRTPHGVPDPVRSVVEPLNPGHHIHTDGDPVPDTGQGEGEGQEQEDKAGYDGQTLGPQRKKEFSLHNDWCVSSFFA